VEAGVDLAVVQQLLGPASITMQLYGGLLHRAIPRDLDRRIVGQAGYGTSRQSLTGALGRLRAPLRRLVGLPRTFGPAVPDRVPQRAGGVAEQRVEPLHPSVHVMWLTSAPRSASSSSTYPGKTVRSADSSRSTHPPGFLSQAVPHRPDSTDATVRPASSALTGSAIGLYSSMRNSSCAGNVAANRIEMQAQARALVSATGRSC
jgi:hypothetical protein